MKIQIKVKNKRDFYEKYLTFLNPLIKLNKTDNAVLASFLSLNDRYKDYNPEVLNKLLFSPETKESIRIKLDLTSKQFNKSIAYLTNKQYISDKGINNRFLYPAVKRDNSITFDFNYDKWKNISPIV